MASFVQINPPCNLCKTDPLSASRAFREGGGCFGWSVSIVLFFVAPFVQNGAEWVLFVQKKHKTQWMMLAIVSAQFAPGGDELIEAFVQNSGWERCLASGA